ncbi:MULTISPECIES: DUF6765 family protein [Spirulina sp. CCY15215]|uniref:DUF6765 family protein n=1 Tax=Spirulina sp. CCY15215 TaxID=2767591 RepID=UPI0027B87D29|nr:DUF6765 family protein [Spirulina major]
MDIEFHYYMTYSIATRAGFSPLEARILAYSSQYVDNNSTVFKIDEGKNSEYFNHITQTFNILKSKNELLKIYPVFHFIPGDPFAVSARRKDGQRHFLNTTPNSISANRIIDDALASKNLYRIGIASHGYVDTWAHQNFVGYYDEFNAVKGMLRSALPHVGHADVKRYPDWPALIWHDYRLISPHDKVNNKLRFLDAAKHLFYKYCFYLEGVDPRDRREKDALELVRDLDRAIGDYDPKNRHRRDRIQRYLALSEQKIYGKEQIPLYNKYLWLERAVTRSENEFGDRNKGHRKKGLFFSLTTFKAPYFWRENYQQSHWYQFQEAAKNQQKAAWNILYETKFRYLDIPQYYSSHSSKHNDYAKI